MDIVTLLFWIVTTIWFVFSLVKDKKRTFESITLSFGMMKKIGPNIIAILLFIGLILTLIPVEILNNFLGESNVFISTLVFAFVGAITLIPGFVAFPLAASLMDAGADIMPIIAFITTLTMVGFVTFPLEKREFGTKFSLIRNSLSFVFALLIALIMGVIL